MESWVAALKALSVYGFPGNVRELENILERAVAMCDNGRIEVDDLRLPESSVGESASALKTGSATSTGANATDAGGSANLIDYIDNLERDAIVKALEECRYNKTKAAGKLGITFRALRYKLKKLGVE